MQNDYGVLVLRIGLAIVMLWFGFSQLFDGINWVGWVPTWAVSLLSLPPAMIVLLNGAFEVIAGTLLAIGLFVRPVSLLLAAHLALIVAEIGLTEIGMRDVGLLFACLALALLPVDRFALRLSRNEGAVAAS